MKLLNRDEILSNNDLPIRDVPVPEWGPDSGVRVRTLPVVELEEFQNSIQNSRKGKVNKRIDLKGTTARLLVITVVDEKGQSVFNEADVAALNQKSAAAVQRIANAAMELNGLKEQDMEELAGN